MRVYAVVEEKEEPVFVTTLNERDHDDFSDQGVEEMVRKWCNRQKPPLTYVDVVY